MDDTLKAALSVAEVLDKLGVRWFLGGSLASSLLGIPRATLDADIIADIRPSDVKPLLDHLGEGWYADEAAIREAINARSSCNLIHIGTAMKVDIFLPKRRRFEAGQFARVTHTPVAEGSDRKIPVCSPEDIVLAKLEWYRLGGEVSERQWSDVLGVLRIHHGLLNLGSMREAAEELGVEELLKRALGELEASG